MLCSFIPVAIGKTLRSKIISQGEIPTFSVRILYALSTISTRLSVVDACPCSSNAITTIAEPNSFIIFACSINFSSPSFKLIEFTIDLPWIHFKPDSITSNFELSNIIGTLAISGSDAIRFKNSTIWDFVSIKAISRLISIIFAPFSICSRATFKASS